jgi:phosphopentomutase
MPDAAAYGDEGSNTLLAAAHSEFFHMPNLCRMGLDRIDGQEAFAEVWKAKLAKTTESVAKNPKGAFDGAVARLCEASGGKDTTVGHWEIAGLVSEAPLPTFPNGFPRELLDEFEKETGRRVLCNLPYSGTEVIRDYGQEHINTGALIVYTSADSVFQIAAHEEIVPLEELYRYCEIARRLCTGKYGVGRIIARPFIGTYPDFTRTSNRHDFSLCPPKATMLTVLREKGFDVYGVGKINDIFAGSGITGTVRTKGNAEGIERTLEHMKEDFCGLCFTNLVDYDMLYGHRNDVDGYAKALTYFDEQLPALREALRPEDILMITADHGCDPSTPSTDHSREYIPLIIYGKGIRTGLNLGTRTSFSDIGATILDYFGCKEQISGTSFLSDILLK